MYKGYLMYGAIHYTFCCQIKYCFWCILKRTISEIIHKYIALMRSNARKKIPRATKFIMLLCIKLFYLYIVFLTTNLFHSINQNLEWQMIFFFFKYNKESCLSVALLELLNPFQPLSNLLFVIYRVSSKGASCNH